jgi:hypothetical protein
MAWSKRRAAATSARWRAAARRIARARQRCMMISSRLTGHSVAAGSEFRQPWNRHDHGMTSDVERKARNEAIFRDANEEIERVRDALSLVDGKTPFFCECEDPRCREIIRLDVTEYEAVRRSPTTFLIAPGHRATTGRVVADKTTYLVVEKLGAAARVARDTDPRDRVG